MTSTLLVHTLKRATAINLHPTQKPAIGSDRDENAYPARKRELQPVIVDAALTGTGTSSACRPYDAARHDRKPAASPR
jgi:hypothetical protein